MNKVFALLIPLFFQTLSIFAQPEFDYPVCSMDDAPIPPSLILSQTADLPGNDALVDYLRMIKKKLGNSNSLFVVKKITQRRTSCAINYKNGSVIQQLIAINEDSYSAKVTVRLQKAMFIWIIGHEITHHINADYFYLNEKDQLKNITKEILCDENAGYLVGALTTDISLDDLFAILATILNDNTNSIYYPPLKERIFAAQAGWLRAKVEQNPTLSSFDFLGTSINTFVDAGQNKRIWAHKVIDSTTIERQEMAKGDNYFGAGSLSSWRTGFGLYINRNESTQDLVDVRYGEWKDGNSMTGKIIDADAVYDATFINWRKEGKGEINWYGEKSSKGRYVGEFKGDNMEGFGVYYFENGDRYSGQWERNKFNGHGVLYHGGAVLQAGCWKDDVFIGDCNAIK